MGLAKVYFSIPVSINWSTAMTCVTQLQGKYDTRYWIRNERYDESLLAKSDAFVMMLPNNSWSHQIETLPVGLRREFKQALLLGIPVFIAYKTGQGYYQFYKTDIQKSVGWGNDVVTALAGTYQEIHKFLEAISPKNSPKKCAMGDIFDLDTDRKVQEPKEGHRIPVSLEYDERLLLML